MEQSKQRLTPSMVSTAIAFTREMHAKHYRLMLEAQSTLLNTLNRISIKGESELTKEDVQLLIKANLAYIKAYNMFSYWDNQKRDLIARYGWCK